MRRDFTRMDGTWCPWDIHDPPAEFENPTPEMVWLCEEGLKRLDVRAGVFSKDVIELGVQRGLDKTELESALEHVLEVAVQGVDFLTILERAPLRE